MVHADIGNLEQKLLCLLGVLVDPRLALSEQLGPAALDHVAEQGPGRAAKANEGNTSRKLLPGEADGLVHVVQLAGYVDGALHHLVVLRVGGGLKRLREVRSFLIHHLDNHPHGLRDDQDIREDNGGVEEPGEALDGLQGQGRGDLGVAAALEEVSRALGLMILGQVAASCR